MTFSAEQILTSVASVLAPSQFVVADGLRCIASPPHEIHLEWEVFRGYLLDPRHTREVRTLITWGVYLSGPEDDPLRSALSSYNSPNRKRDFSQPTPLLSVFWDRDEKWLAVTRQILCYDWDDLITDLSLQPGMLRRVNPPNPPRPPDRPRYWARELVGTIQLDERSDDPDALRRELARYVEMALVGTSRLPITSPETPLPSFSFGLWTYLPHEQGDAGPSQTIDQAIVELTPTTDRRRAARIVEAALRAGAMQVLVPRVREGAATSSPGAEAGEPLPWLDWLRTMFHQVSLTPVTQWSDRTLELLDVLAQAPAVGRAAVCDLVGHMLSHLLRHLTAYDLERFHSFGANYPDALWLDQLLRYLCQQIEGERGLFLNLPGDSAAERIAKRLRRRALRQGWLVRRHYEGLRVPAEPTSLGEQRRVMPDSYPVASEEEIEDRKRRPQTLYADSPLEITNSAAISAVFQQALLDLEEPSERRAMGLATFLDRPFGIFKSPGAPDRSPLVAYEAFSPSIARTRMVDLQRRLVEWPLVDAQQVPSSTVWEEWCESASSIAPRGREATQLPGQSRQGVIMLEDARVAQPDFRIEAMVRSSWQLLAELPWGLSAEQREQFASIGSAPQRWLLLRTATDRVAATGAPWITIFDATGAERGQLRLAAPQRAGEYQDRDGIEFPTGGVVMTLDGKDYPG